MRAALSYECETDPDDCNDFRLDIALSWILQAERLNDLKVELLPGVHPHIVDLVSKLHPPFTAWIVDQICAAGFEFPDPGFSEALLHGMPGAGVLPPFQWQSAGDAPRKSKLSVDELRASKREINEEVLSRVRPQEYLEDLWSSVLEDQKLGAVGPASLVEDSDLDSLLFCRRLTVREEREKGWRTRCVDHETECGLNEATQPTQRTGNGSVLALIQALLFFFAVGLDARCWKRDISKAFRRVPVCADDLDLMFFVWLDNDELWKAGHRGCPFGAVSSVQNWHRCGNFLQIAILILAKAFVDKYVDDFFGCSRLGVWL